jgi:hypothetical protein
LANETKQIPSTLRFVGLVLVSSTAPVTRAKVRYLPSTACYPRPGTHRAVFGHQRQTAQNGGTPNRNPTIPSASKFGYFQGRPLQEGTAIRLAGRPCPPALGSSPQHSIIEQGAWRAGHAAWEPPSQVGEQCASAFDLFRSRSPPLDHHHHRPLRLRIASDRGTPTEKRRHCF